MGVILVALAITAGLALVAWVIFDIQFISGVIGDFFEDIKMKFIK